MRALTFRRSAAICQELGHFEIELATDLGSEEQFAPMGVIESGSQRQTLGESFT